MRRLTVLLLLLAPAFADEAPAAKSTRMYPLKYADADQIRRLFSTYSYPMTANREFNVLTVTAPPPFHTQVEGAIKEFDVAPAPPRNIELTLYVVTGADKPSAQPKELEAVEKQFTTGGLFKGILVSDTQVLRTRAGLPAESGAVRIRAAWVNGGDKSKVVSVDGLRVTVKGCALAADIDVPEGRAVVVGKAGPDGLIVVVAKVTE
jgi:hypothetical protein